MSRHLTVRYLLKKHGLASLPHWPKTFSLNESERVEDSTKWLKINLLRLHYGTPLLQKIARENLKL